ncbi:MAG: DUF1353 domain-containing protein [Lentisphaeria bacterium]|nr:DUF1353 domain-containing protein [Lentisphaeria bacterium]
MLKVAVHSEDEKGNVYTLLEDVTVHWQGKTLVIPAGFKSDGASVPRFFWRIVFPPGDSRALRAAIAHDFIYRTHPEGWTRKMADDMFYDLLREDGVCWFNAQGAYCGVRLFGGSSWET